MTRNEKIGGTSETNYFCSKKTIFRATTTTTWSRVVNVVNQQLFDSILRPLHLLLLSTCTDVFICVNFYFKA